MLETTANFAPGNFRAYLDGVLYASGPAATVPAHADDTGIGGMTGNQVGTDPELTAPTSATAPSWQPMAGSPVLSGCATPPAGFDAAGSFCGAVGASDWTTGWTAFPQ